jgi:hypothetical protein
VTVLLILVVLGFLGFVTFVAATLTDPDKTTRNRQEPQAPGGFTRPAPGPSPRRWT